MSWNARNPSIRRIQADIQELARHPSDQYAARPCEDNMFDWHFTIRGPEGTDFSGGVYHGRIILPKDYPFKPPSITFLTPNGRWEVRQKICLSISSYHPEQWQPAWGIRTILEALISFMASKDEGLGAVGAINASSETRKHLAKESLFYKHELMPPLPPLKSKVKQVKKDDENVDSGVDEKEKGSNSECPKAEDADDKEDNEMKERYRKQVALLHVHNMGPVSENERGSDLSKSSKEGKNNNNNETRTNANLEGDQNKNTAESNLQENVSVNANNVRPVADANTNSTVRSNVQTQQYAPPEEDFVDSILKNVSMGLMMAIFAVLYAKALDLYT